MSEEVYTVGDSPVPGWCRRYLTPYKRMDGSVGWEFWGVRKAFVLHKGDKLILKKGKVKVRSGRERTEEMV